MNTYIICYDLSGADGDYADLIDDLTTLNANHLQDSVWLLKTEIIDCEQVKNLFVKHLHDTDHFYVARLDPNSKPAQFESSHVSQANRILKRLAVTKPR